jgi:hypothetical protein
MQWFYLSMAIVAEVIATSALKASEDFSRLIPSLAVNAGYATAFNFLSLYSTNHTPWHLLCGLVPCRNHSRVGDRLAPLRTKVEPQQFEQFLVVGGKQCIFL